MKVLIVEDSAEVRNVLSVILHDRFDADVRQARIADDAIELCATEQFDVVLMDIYIPGASGDDLVEIVRDGGRCPVIVITGDGELSPARLGAAEVILKPFAAGDIVAALTKLGFEETENER